MHEDITKYIEYLFAIALKKCENIADAEDLTQETLLAALRYLDSGKDITNLKYWLTSTLSHKWNDMLRKKYKLPTVSIDTFPEVDDCFLPAFPFDEALDTEPDDTEVRREVAYLAKLQREVIVRHYLQGQKVQNIADELSIPKGTVLSRLASGREQMRKGFENMKEYEKQSYTPEHLDLSCNGRSGFNEEPWSLVANDLMKQNILIMAYEKPLTIIEIAKALGIPTPYIENATLDLVNSELMCRQGNKVFTDFMIVTPDDCLKCLDAELEFADKYYSEIWSCITALFSEVQKLNWYKEFSDREQTIIKYYSMLNVFSRGIYTAMARLVDTSEEFPARPDGGAWIAIGNRYPADFDYDNYLFRKYCYGGERRAYWERFLSSKSIDLHVFDTQPDLNKYEHGPVPIHDDNLCKLLYIIHAEIPFDSTGFNPMFLEDIPHLVECGVLRYENGLPRLAIPVLSKSQYDELFKLIKTHIIKLADILEVPLKETLPSLKLDIPKHLTGRIAEFRQYSCHAIPMAVVKQAIELGDFLSGVNYPTPPMVFVVEE